MLYRLDTKKLIIILASSVFAANAEFRLVPLFTEAVVGESTYFDCTTTTHTNEVQWYHYRVGAKDYEDICLYCMGTTHPQYENRIEVQRNASTDSYRLTINSVQLEDAGSYICHDNGGIGDSLSAQLIVLASAPICHTNMKPDGLLGPNSCNIDPDGLQMSCNVAYHGNIKPMLQWREIRSIDYIEKGLYCWRTGFNVTCDVALKASFDLHGSSYVCETTRHNCSSGVVRIIHANNNNSVSKLAYGTKETVICSANSSQLCNYTWKWVDEGDEEVISTSAATVIPWKTGLYKCEAECSIREKQCTVLSRQILVTGDWMKLINLSVPLVLVAVSVSFVVIFIKKWLSYKSRGSSSKRKPNTGVYEEVCVFETFKTNCSEDEVIVVEKAIYGQGLDSNRCDKNGATDVGSCSFDVLMYFDRKCGGWASCKVEIPNKYLSELNGLSCKSQQNLYLSISYNCVYVYSAPSEMCVNNQSLTVSTSEGHLSSSVAAETNKGSSMCPWKIQLNRSQSVHFNMLDFGLQQSNATSYQDPVCSIYATFVLHHYTGEISRSVACGGDMKQQRLPIDVSTAKEVYIWLANLSKKGEDATSFLIKYEVFYRCPEFIPPANAFVTKTSNGLRVTCSKKTESNWLLQCVDGRWMPDPLKTCDHLISAHSTSSLLEYGMRQKWLLTGLPVGIVLPVGVLISVGVFWLLRKKRRLAEKASNSCSSAHHYSDVDIDQFTPEIITNINSEDPDVYMDQTDSTAVTPYFDLKHPSAVPMPTVYLSLQNDNHIHVIWQDSQHNEADDSNSTELSVTPTYGNVARQ